MRVMKLLGIDNVFFQVANLEKAILFYEKLGFQLKLKIPQLPGVLFRIGNEEPGLILSETREPKPSRMWVEVENAKTAQTLCAKLGIHGYELETGTGYTFEVQDTDGNIIGFADYVKKPELGRSHQRTKSPRS